MDGEILPYLRRDKKFQRLAEPQLAVSMAKCLSHSPPSFHFGAAAFALASLRAKFCWLAESKLGTAIPSQKPAFARCYGAAVFALHYVPSEDWCRW